MSQTKVKVQALRYVPTLQTMQEGEEREFSIDEARLLIALGHVKVVDAKPRAKKVTEAE
jgi:hypothetical protein